jgi:hypothetical protein
MSRFFQPKIVTPDNVIHCGERITDDGRTFVCLGGNDLNIPYYRQLDHNGRRIGPVISIAGDSRACHYA